ncbi:hypothetical protein JOQ06_025910 [Pogonophryne albipinna]|uniref:DDE Tnp4 domain-containing protein n=1 Tax=Pogonophryne albipinna TaxID=1090488 RepID=A0AAD6AAD5_9TELE|nr:hypothetical protein JOQ06_025910 [Pogonophryne albipinna]
MDQSKDLRFDYRLSRESIEALMTLLRREKTHGWVQHVEVLLVVYWLAHGLSYSVVSRVFDVPKTTVFDIVHRMSGHYIVGDGGSPCLREPLNLITPYREPLRGRVEARFTRHHARARSVVERAFGMMKARWRGIFFKALEVDHSFSPKVIAVCAVLHNICLTAGDILEPTEGGDPVLLPPQGPVQRDMLVSTIGTDWQHTCQPHMSVLHT